MQQAGKRDPGGISLDLNWSGRRGKVGQGCSSGMGTAHRKDRAPKFKLLLLLLWDPCSWSTFWETFPRDQTELE